MKLAACVILYNPDDSVVGNVLSYADSVDKIWLIDNSDQTNAAVEPLLSDARIQYLKLDQNFGIAYALNRACELAMNESFKWIPTMDQDSSIDADKFFPNLNPDLSVAAIFAASFKGTKGRWIKPYNEHYNEIHYTITSGSVMSLDVWKSVGGFDENLFIDEVDHDMCMKIRNYGSRILTTKEPCLNHTIGVALKEKTESTTRFRPQPFRCYYHVRNSLTMVTRYIFTQPRFAFNRVFNLSKTIFRIVAYYPDKAQYFRYVGKGGLDFITRRKGKLK